jgi:hypothetical protein
MKPAVAVVRTVISTFAEKPATRIMRGRPANAGMSGVLSPERTEARRGDGT